MNKTQQRHIEVYAHWEDLSQPILVGTLTATPSRGKEIFSFVYHDGWRKVANALGIYPCENKIRCRMHFG